jgi:DNA-binding transcriptional LysR family regulator
MFKDIGTESLVPVSAIDRSGAIAFDLDNAGSVQFPLLTYPDKTYLSNIVEAIIRSNNVSFEKRFVNVMASVLKAQVKQGAGVAWIPQRLIIEELQQKKLVVAGERHWWEPLTIRFYLISDQATPRSVWRAAKPHAKREFGA